VQEGEGKKKRKWKWGLISDSEDECSVMKDKKVKNKTFQFLKSDTEDDGDYVSTPVQRITPKRKVKVLIQSLPRKVVDRREALVSDVEEYSPVPPVKKRRLLSLVVNRELPEVVVSCSKLNFVQDREADDNDEESTLESEVNKSNGSDEVEKHDVIPITKLSGKLSDVVKSSTEINICPESEVTAVMVEDDNNQESTEERDLKYCVINFDAKQDDLNPAEVVVESINNNEVQSSHQPEQKPNGCDQVSVGSVSLPLGYSADKLAKVLICLLEEKIKVSSSHSERELFRKTVHVLLCGGCKDREKHNKVRCRRCEERKTGDKVKKSDKDKMNNEINDSRDVKVKVNKGKIIEKNVTDEDAAIGKLEREDRNGITITNDITGTAFKSVENSDGNESLKFCEIKTKESFSPTKCVREGELAGPPTNFSCCGFCGEQFKQVEDFQVHTHLPHVRDCLRTGCGMKFVDLGALIRHTVNKHRNAQNEEKETQAEGRLLVQSSQSISCESAVLNRSNAGMQELLTKDLGKKIDRDKIFGDSDIDESEEELGDGEASNFVLAELIHDDEIDTELAINLGGKDQVMG